MENLSGREVDLHGVQSVSKALELLCCFSADRPEWGVTEIAEYLGLCKSAVHRILATFERYNFVTRTPSRRYRLGRRAAELGNVYRFDRSLLWKAEPVIRRLADTTQSIAHLGELDGREVLELMRSAGPNAVIFTSSPRFRAPVHATALGKVLLASGGEIRMNQYLGPLRALKRFTPYTIVSTENLRRELSVVSRQGYAVSNQESVLGCRCLGVPVRNQLGNVVAALSVSSTVDRFSDINLPRVLAQLRSAAETISRETQE
jgi:DNA-binding IclR family transcriptional regulator